MFQIFRRSVAQHYVQRLAQYWRADAQAGLLHGADEARRHVAGMDSQQDRLSESLALSRVGAAVGAASAVISAVASQAPLAHGWAGDLMAAAGMLSNYAAPGGFAVYGAARWSALRIAAQMGHAGVDAVPQHPDGLASLSGLVVALRGARSGEHRAALMARASDVVARLADPSAIDVAEFALEVSHRLGSDAALQWCASLPEKIAQDRFVRATIQGIELRQASAPLESGIEARRDESESVIHSL